MAPQKPTQRGPAAHADARILAMPTVGGLRGLLEAAVTEALAAAPGADVRVTLDVAAEHAIHDDPAAIRRAILPLLRDAVEAAAEPAPRGEGPRLREVVVTTVDTGEALEIEVADSGAAVRVVTGSPDVRSVVERLGATVTAVGCPEGGTAVTLRLPRRRARSMAA